MRLYTGTVVSIYRSLYLVVSHEVRPGRNFLNLVNLDCSNCSAGLKCKMIGDVMVAKAHYTDEDTDEVLLEKFQVRVVARNVKEYITDRLVYIQFPELHNGMP